MATYKADVILPIKIIKSKHLKSGLKYKNCLANIFKFVGHIALARQVTHDKN